MEQALEQPRLVQIIPPGFEEAWEMAAGQLRLEMKASVYDSWVKPLRPLSFKEGVFRIGAANPYGRKWVEQNALRAISNLLESILNQPVTVRVVMFNSQAADLPTVADSSQTAVAEPTAPETSGTVGGGAENAPSAENGRKKKTAQSAAGAPESGSPRKIQLQRAYGTERARVIQPERGMFLTRYFFMNWLPLIGHSALTTVLAARSLCYWNPMNGELRNTVETDMSELAKLASVSVRTVKDVLNNELIKRYFLRYKVRRIMTPNGVRTAGILLQVRMDDPLTPEDQEHNSLPEEERWYTVEFEGEEEE